MVNTRMLGRWGQAAALLTLIGGCAHNPPFPPSEGHISQPAMSQPPARSEIPDPVRIAPYVPPPKAAEKMPTYSVVVSEVPVKELLFALARDTRHNIDIHPNIQGLVTLNAVNETLPAILERVAKQVSIRYKIEGNTLIVTPDSPYLKTYRVNYVNVARDTTSSIGVAAQIASTGTGTATGQTGAGGNNSSTTVSSTSRNNFWEVLGENIRNILGSTKAATQSAEEKQARMEAARSAREERMAQVEAVSRAGAGATNLFTTAFGGQPGQPAVDGKSEVIVNPVAGTVSVLGSERQQALVQQYLDGIMASAQRQVLIEATIVEVTLSDEFKAGVDWSRIASGAGFTINQQMLGSNLASAPNITIGYANTTSQVGNISGTIKLLEHFGNIRVLSSPKLMALNNQSALLKVVDNLVYFSVEVQPGSTTGSTITPATYSTTPHTVPVGVVMSVMPQINDNGMVSLIVRPTISRVLKYEDDPNPALGSGSTRIKNSVPVVQVREMESILQVISGQTVVLGGLMQDDISRKRDGVPGLASLPGVGDAFAYRDESTSKTELVIFLRPTVISHPSLDSDELRFYRRFLPSAQAPAAP